MDNPAEIKNLSSLRPLRLSGEQFFLLMIVANLKAMIIAQLILPGQVQVMTDHLRDHLLECNPRLPAKLFLSLGRISKQGLHLRRPEVSGINAYDNVAVGERS